MSKEEMNWIKTIQNTLTALHGLGIYTYYSHVNAVRRLHQYFRKKLTFPHPARDLDPKLKGIPFIFTVFPEGKEKFVFWCNQNIDTLTGDRTSTYINTELLPWIHQLYSKDTKNPLPMEH